MDSSILPPRQVAFLGRRASKALAVAELCPARRSAGLVPERRRREIVQQEQTWLSRFASIGEHREFNAALDQHCREASRIIKEFSGGWYGKTLYEKKGISQDDARQFAHAMTPPFSRRQFVGAFGARKFGAATARPVGASNRNSVQPEAIEATPRSAGAMAWSRLVGNVAIVVNEGGVDAVTAWRGRWQAPGRSYTSPTLAAGWFRSRGKAAGGAGARRSIVAARRDLADQRPALRHGIITRDDRSPRHGIAPAGASFRAPSGQHVHARHGGAIGPIRVYLNRTSKWLVHYMPLDNLN